MVAQLQWSEQRQKARLVPCGFSLIEMVIVLAVIALLAVMAYPAYTDQMRKTARKEAVGKMLEIASRLEQFRTQKLAYPSGAQLDDFVFNGTKYDIVVEAVTGGVAVKATPVANSTQASDRCGVITYTTPGIWSFSGTGMTEADCI